MQFSCESCKATLQIADEKVKGKRLLVRCKRCGAKITIFDPALGAAPRPAAMPAPAPAATPAPAPAAAPAPAPAAAPAPARAAAAPSPAAEPDGDRDTDTESTRAMDSDLLEKALRASKDESALSSASGLSPVGNGPARSPLKASPPPPPREIATPRDPAIWFAMIGGKQAGPMSRAEIGLKTAQGGLGPRTYLWKEGMASWLRAKDVAELGSLFGAPPESAPEIANKASQQAGKKAEGMREFGTADFGSLDLSAEEARRTQKKAEVEFSTQDLGSLNLAAEAPRSRRVPEAQKRSGGQPSAVNPFAEPTPAEKKKPALQQALTPALGSPAHEAIQIDDGPEEDSTHVDQLPLGERVHQESVASELFNSGEQASPGAAADLARWASSELGKQKSSQPKLKTPRQPGLLDPSQGQAQPGGPVSQVPDSPGRVAQHESTGEMFARTGVQQGRGQLISTLLVLAVVALAGVAYAFFSGGDTPQQEVAHEVARPSLGGTGEKVDLTRQPAPSLQKPAAPPSSAAPGKVAKPPEPEKLSPEQEAAMKSLDNERGIGTHGPKEAQGESAEASETGSGGLTAEAVRKKLDENKGALQSCIDDALHRDPNLRVGKILIATTIAPSGVVTAAKIDKRTVDESPLGSCLKKATRRIVFPSFTGEAFEVEIPIVVNSNQ